MNESVAIQINKLSKRYSSAGIYALKDLDITINKGEVYGFLGPNGAGKSTTIRTLLNFIQPTDGSATILGKDIIKDSVEIRRSIGYLSGDFSAYKKMTGKQFLEYMSELQPPKRKNYSAELTKRFKASTNKKISELSKGNRQKFGIIQAVMHEPELLILDEPTDGLDPLMQEEFYNLIRDMKKQGKTVFVSSHNLGEVKKMCDRIGFIKDGRLEHEYTIAEMALEASQTFDVSFAKPVTLAQLKKIPGLKKVTSKGENNYEIHVHGSLSPFLRFLSQRDVRHLATQELNLEDQFLKFYETERRR